MYLNVLFCIVCKIKTFESNLRRLTFAIYSKICLLLKHSGATLKLYMLLLNAFRKKNTAFKMLLRELSVFFLALCENKCSSHFMSYGHPVEFSKCH